MVSVLVTEDSWCMYEVIVSVALAEEANNRRRLGKIKLARCWTCGYGVGLVWKWNLVLVLWRH